MKDHIVRRLCCGCMEAAADASSSPHPVYIEMSPSSPRPPTFFSSLDPTVSPAISCTSTRMTKSTSISNIISSRSLATYFKVEEEPKRAQEKGFKKLVSEWPAPHVTVKPLSSVVIVPAPSTDPSSSVSPTIFPPQFHGNLQPGPTNEPSPLEKHREEHVTDSTGTSTSQNKAPGTFLLADKNWAAGYVLASPSSPSADPVRESFIARLVEGVQVAMHSHTGHSRIQLLCTLDGAETFTWREGEAGNQVAHMEHWSSAGSGIFWGARESYAFGDIIEVRRGITPDLSNPGETGTASLRAACKNRDLSRSFSLITADGTIYLSCEQVETASLLVKGFMALSHEQRRRRVRRRNSIRAHSPSRSHITPRTHETKHMASLWRPLRPQGAKTAPTASLRVLASSFPTNLTEATSLFLILPSRSMSSTSSMKRPSAATSVRNGQRRPHIINYHQHNQVPPRNGEEMSNLAPTPRDLFPAPPAFEALAHRVTQAVQAKDLPAAMTHLRQLDALYLPSLPSSPISSSVRLLISGTAYAVLHLCLAERKRTEGEKGIEEALDVLTMPNLATSYDKACTRIAFTTLPITDTSSWPTTMAFFRKVLTYLTPAAWPAPHQFHRALRQLADAGQPTQCQWLLDRMRCPQALAPPHEEGKEDRRQPSFLPPPPIPIGSAGQLHSPRWHLLKSYLYSHQPLQAVRLLQTEKNLRLDCNTTNMVLKGLARERLGQDALNFLKWAEEEVGVKTTTESYNKVIIALAKTNRSFHPYASSSSFQRFPHPCPPSADKDGHAISAPTAAVDAEADAASPIDTTAAAREVLARMNAKEILPDHVSYCALLDVYAEANDVKGAVAMFFGEMCQVGREGGGEGGKSGIMPTDVAFGTLMKAFARVGEWRKVLMCVEGMHELGITDEREVCYALAAYACGKAGRWREVVGLVDGLKEREGGVRTLKTYIFAMHTCGKAGRYGEARRLLEEVQGRGDLMEGMDAYAYNLAMHICARNGDQGGALRWWGMMKEARRERGLDNFNVGALLTAFGAEGQWEEGLAFVEEVVLSTGRPVPDAALALLALRAAKAGRGEEVVERVLELLSKHQQSIPSFLHGAMCLALAESGQYAKGLGMALAEAPRKEQLRSAGMGEEEWREKVKEKEEGEEGEESMDDYVRTQLAFVQLKQTPWPVAWCLVDGLEAQGLLHSTAVEVATEALARKDGYELFACGLERHRGRAWREAEVVADESSSDAHISSSRSLNEEGANSQEEDEDEMSNDEEEAVRWAMVLNPRAAPIPSRSSPSSPSSCSMSYIDRHHSRHAEHGWAAAAAAAFSSFSGPWR